MYIILLNFFSHHLKCHTEQPYRFCQSICWANPCFFLLQFDDVCNFVNIVFVIGNSNFTAFYLLEFQTFHLHIILPTKSYKNQLSKAVFYSFSSLNERRKKSQRLYGDTFLTCIVGGRHTFTCDVISVIPWYASLSLVCSWISREKFKQLE